MRTVLYVLVGLCVVAASFGATLYAIDHWAEVTGSQLEIAMKKSGYTMTDKILVSLDSVKRDFGGQLAVSGWAVDKEQGQPVSIYVLVDGKFDLIATANAPRADIASSLHLTPEQSRHVAFDGHSQKAFDCKLLEHAPVVAVNQAKHLVKVADGLRVPLCH
jgi:hypothetical protein